MRFSDLNLNTTVSTSVEGVSDDTVNEAKEFMVNISWINLHLHTGKIIFVMSVRLARKTKGTIIIPITNLNDLEI